MIRENKLIKGITVNDVEHRFVQFADDTQLMSEVDAISSGKIIDTVDTFGRKSGLVMNSSHTQTVWLGNKRRSLTKCLRHMKIDWNPS